MKKTQVVWLGYFLVLLMYVGQATYRFFVPGETTHLYFTILYAFDDIFLLNYLVNLCQITLNLIHLVPVLLYIFRMRVFNAKFWQYLLILRLMFDIFGHSFEMLSLRSLLYLNVKVFLFVLAQSVSVYIPSYIACYRYAFKRDKLFPQDE